MKELVKFLPVQRAFLEDYSLTNSESWRWDKKDALLVERSKIEFASMQSTDPEFIITFPAPDFSAFMGIEDAPLAQLNLELTPEFFYSFVGENKEFIEPVVMHLDGLGNKLQLSKIFAGLKKNSKTLVWLDLSAEKNVWQNLFLQVEIWENSELDLVIWLGEKDKSQTAQTIFIHALQAKNSQLRINAIEKNSSFSRVDVVSELNGENAFFSFGGIQKGDSEANVDFHIKALHNAPNCQSRQILRGILNDKALGIYSGLILVKEGSQQTEAMQDCRYLLLSDEAISQAMPQLEIYADDVKCNHGATVGKIDEESLFYLQSRGISKTEAEKILISSFTSEAIVVKGKLEEMLKKAINSEE